MGLIGRELSDHRLELEMAEKERVMIRELVSLCVLPRLTVLAANQKG